MDIKERFASLACAGGGVAAWDGVVIERDTGNWRRLYEQLAVYHYRAGPPATCVGAWTARHTLDKDNDTLIGVLLVSMPVLNSAWRHAAWPGDYRTGDKRADTRRLNAEVRCISRVIVHPRWRGVGVGKQLVQAYLREAMSVRTEAVAAMGAASPFFKAAGMREHIIEPSRRDAALVAALKRRGVKPWRLGDVARCARLIERDAAMERTLRTWAKASKGTSRSADASVRDLVKLAARSVACQPRAYAWG